MQAKCELRGSWLARRCFAPSRCCSLLVVFFFIYASESHQLFQGKRSSPPLAACRAKSRVESRRGGEESRVEAHSPKREESRAGGDARPFSRSTNTRCLRRSEPRNEPREVRLRPQPRPRPSRVGNCEVATSAGQLLCESPESPVQCDMFEICVEARRAALHAIPWPVCSRTTSRARRYMMCRVTLESSSARRQHSRCSNASNIRAVAGLMVVKQAARNRSHRRKDSKRRRAGLAFRTRVIAFASDVSRSFASFFAQVLQFDARRSVHGRPHRLSVANC